MTGLFDARSDYAVRFANERSRALRITYQIDRERSLVVWSIVAITSVISRNTVFHFLNDVFAN